MSKKLIMQLMAFMYVIIFGTRETEKTIDQGYYEVTENLRRVKIMN